MLMRAQAQDPSILLSASPGWNLLASAPLGNFDTLKIPLKRAGNLLLLEAEVDGLRGDFILDTGAPGLVLNTAYFRQSAKKRVRQSVGVAGISNEVYQLDINRLTIKELYFEKISAELTELSHIENSKGVKILGLLGNALFEDLVMRIDLRNNSLFLYREKENKSKVTKSIASDIIQLNMSYQNHALFIPMRIENKSVNVYFDTGAEQMVLDNYLPKSIMKNVTLTKRLNLRGTGGQKLEVWSGSIAEVALQNLALSNVPVIITGLEDLSQAYGQAMDAIIGYPILEQGIVEINYKRKLFNLYIYKEDENE